MVEVVLSAFLIGASVTTLRLTDYFQHPLFFAYLLNAIGDVHFYLPGVFENNPGLKVNAQLWTVPFELLCYTVLTGLVILDGRHRKILIPLAALVFAAGHIAWRLHKYHGDFPIPGGLASGPLLFLWFFTGVSFYQLRNWIIWSSRIFAAALIASVVCLSISAYYDYLGIVALTYVTVYIGLTNFQRLAFLKGADYSYGIFLYSFVIQQLYVSLGGPRHWWMSALVCLPVTVLFAAFSWHFVEKPAQNLRKLILVLEKHYLVLKNSFTQSPSCDSR